jgi:hypothetical protein
MATADYWTWDRAGRPFRRPPWLTQLKALAKAHGVPFLGDLGSDDVRHLQAARPQDHCPFSWTEWPVQIDEYVINAIDLGRGDWAYRLIGYAKAGRAPWVKYVNIDRKHYSRKNNWVPIPNSDVHGHVSGMSNHTWTGLAGLNPFVEGDSMTDPSTFYEPSSDVDDAQQHNTERYLQALVGMHDARDISAVSAARHVVPNRLATILLEINGKLDRLLEQQQIVTPRPMGLLRATLSGDPGEGDGGIPAGADRDEADR